MIKKTMCLAPLTHFRHTGTPFIHKARVVTHTHHTPDSEIPNRRGRQTNRKNRETNTQTERQAGRQTDRFGNSKPPRKEDKQKEQRDKHTNRETACAWDMLVRSIICINMLVAHILLHVMWCQCDKHANGVIGTHMQLICGGA